MSWTNKNKNGHETILDSSNLDENGCIRICGTSCIFLWHSRGQIPTLFFCFAFVVFFAWATKTARHSICAFVSYSGLLYKKPSVSHCLKAGFLLEASTVLTFHISVGFKLGCACTTKNKFKVFNSKPILATNCPHNGPIRTTFCEDFAMGLGYILAKRGAERGPQLRQTLWKTKTNKK